MFLLTILLVLQAGPLVLLYHCTHYACRSGHSANGTICGVFFVSPGLSATDQTWHVGAALSFGLCTHYAMRGAPSTDGTVCGTFCIIIRRIASDAYWHFGAALE